MGGSGSSGWEPTPPRDPCGTLSFRASLNSPQPAVVALLTVGHVLSIGMAPAPQHAVQVSHGMSVAGTLTGPKISSLINCLLNGYCFEAEVVSISGGHCVVDVRPV